MISKAIRILKIIIIVAPALFAQQKFYNSHMDEPDKLPNIFLDQSRFVNTITSNNSVRIDSLYIYSLNNELNSKYSILYDNQNRITEFLLKFDNGSTWEKSLTNKYFYDSNDNLILELSLDWSGAKMEFDTLSRTEKSYNTRGQLTQSRRQIFENNEWKNISRYIYEYHIDSLSFNNIYQRWTAGDWINDMRSQHFYSNKDYPDSILFMRWENNKWANWRRTVYNFHESVEEFDSIIVYAWTEYKWNNFLLREIVKDDNNRQIDILDMIWGNDEWLYESQKFYDYYEATNVIDNASCRVWNTDHWEKGISDLIIEFSDDIRFGFITHKIQAFHSDIKNWVDYYPLHIGNKWFYEVIGLENYEPPYNFIVKDTFYVEVLSDTLMPNSISYAELSREFGPGKYVRADSNGIYYYNEFDSSDALIFDLFAELNEPYHIHHGDLIVAELFNKDTIYIFEDSVVTYLYDVDGLIQYGITFAEKYGPIQKNNSGVPSSFNLIGCEIDGQRYGYSPLVGVDRSESIDLKNVMELYQNYPNPFNPVTTIKYSIPSKLNSESLNVKLFVYDILGREVATLVNEKQKAGNYKVEFNGSELSSGIYFYKLVAGNHMDVKKMTLIK